MSLAEELRERIERYDIDWLVDYIYENKAAILAALEAQEGMPGKADVLHMQQFWEKYALGPKSAPSCLVCGKIVPGINYAIMHAELPGIVVCASCAGAARLRERIKGRTPLPDSDDLCPQPYKDDEKEVLERILAWHKEKEPRDFCERRTGVERRSLNLADSRQVAGTKFQRGAAATSQHPTKTDGAAASAQSAPLPDRIEALLSVSPVKLDISGALGWQVNAANLLREAAKELRK